MPGPVFTRGDRIELRTVEDEDLPHLQRLRNDPELRVFAGGPPEPFDEPDTEGFLEWLREDDTMALLACIDGEYVGMVTLKRIQRPHDTADAGVHIAPDEQGKGYATEACSLVLDYAFDQLGLHKVGAYSFDFNEPSQALLEKLGFTHEGRRREERFANGEHHDVHYYGLLAREWRARRDG
ncbi:GNAT family N-acetyltransferase [Haloarchaeobius amylolyticus]|uniref:GNAT family N-acetyltransferase n=1 Tax=Haloarchaeobius amylolyticus TaxID=1198296 RepID=UPI002271E6BA|nr:GNAT family protein [Haloarchaeobius amylolyticus]